MKSAYRQEEIGDFLSRRYHERIEWLPVSAGETSQTFAYAHRQEKRILRIHPSPEGFRKDQYAYTHFCSASVPIPPVLEIGPFDDTHFYCISVRTEGRTYQDSDEFTVKRLLPDLTRLLQSLSETDISGSAGYGVFDSATGNAPFSSWKACLEALLDPLRFDWDAVLKKEWIDSRLVTALIAAFRSPIPACPEIRTLYHGDFGSNNLLVDETPRFSGVIDWDCAGYGDFLYDVATAYFWRTWLMCMAHPAAYWDEVFAGLPHYRERIRCYALHIGLSELYASAAEGNASFTRWLLERCRALVQEA